MISTSSLPVSVGEVLTLKCSEGYEMGGDNQVTCASDLTLISGEEPQCGKYYSLSVVK